MFIRSAASTCETPRGSRNSFSSISPGCVGGRLVGSMGVLSVIVGAPHIVGVVSVEPKHHAVLVVDSNGVKPGEVAHERVEAIAGRHSQVLEPGDRIDLV